MRQAEVEHWVLNILERVEGRQPVEDSRVELKLDWIAAQEAARRLAAHANSARGEPILWLIGVDEKEGFVKGASEQELANWYAQIKAQYDEGFAPAVMNVNVPYKGVTIVALLFDTDRAPYVVKNPEGGRIQFEVPWREHNSTRTARRTDLIKILVPLQKVPALDVFNGELTVQELEENHLIKLSLTCYIIPKEYNTIVVPDHMCEGYYEITGRVKRSPFDRIHLLPPSYYTPFSHEFVVTSRTIEATDAEALIHGPGKVIIEGEQTTRRFPEKDVRAITAEQPDVKIYLRIQAIEADVPNTIEVVMTYAKPGEGWLWKWVYEK